MSQKIKLTLDQVDTIILFNISAGWGSNKFLQKVCEKGETTIVDRVERLEAIGLIKRIDPRQRFYKLSDLGQKILKKSIYQVNIGLLSEYKDINTVLADDLADYLYSEYLQQ